MYGCCIYAHLICIFFLSLSLSLTHTPTLAPSPLFLCFDILMVLLPLHLNDHTGSLLLLLLVLSAAGLGVQHRLNGGVEHLLQTLLCTGRALAIGNSANLMNTTASITHLNRCSVSQPACQWYQHCNNHGNGKPYLVLELHTHLECDGLCVLLLQPLEHLGVFTQIELGSDEHDGHIGTVVPQLGHPFGLNVVVRGGVHHREACQEDVCVRVGQRSQTIVVLLAGSIPQTERDGLVVPHDVGIVVILL